MLNRFQKVTPNLRRFTVLFCLIFAGEIIFSLPFHVARFFRPTLLSVFELSNTGLGDVFAVFGITATLVYFPGGILADFFSARKLMATSLIATAAGGLYMAQIPSHTGLSLLFGYWGVTSILLFWAAMIKATREWGGESKQGSAFGLLDGGRGLVAAVLASVAVVVLSSFLPADTAQMTMAERRTALQNVIYFYSAMTGLAAILIWIFVPDVKHPRGSKLHTSFHDILNVLQKKTVWLQAAIVVCAYCAYKGLDNFALYAVDVLGMNEVESAQFTSQAAWLRPIAAITAGFLANRITSSRVITISFALLVVSYIVLSSASPSNLSSWILYSNIVVTFSAVYALRGVYFALLEESKVSSDRTGAAVGVISLVGFTPDMFFTPLAGRILDAAPGLAGHQHFFMLMVVIVAVGVLATVTLRFAIKHQATTLNRQTSTT